MFLKYRICQIFELNYNEKILLWAKKLLALHWQHEKKLDVFLAGPRLASMSP